jgi:RND family efflux transporter MFP subunit
MTTGKKIINLLFAPLIVAVAVFAIIYMVKSRRTPPPRQPVVAVPAVEVSEVSPADVVPVISTFGNVRAFYQSEIASQVGGRIEEIAPQFDPGRAVNQGDLLARIEEADYKTALAERESALAAIQQTLADEETRTRIAREDWIASGRKLEDAPEFTLRKPQLAAAKAAMQAADAAVTQSLLDIQRTAIRAPFDAVVETRTASPGNVVAAGTSIGSLIARDKAEVRLPLSPEQAARLDLPLAFVSTTAKPIKATLHDPNRPGLEWDTSITRTEVGVDQKNQVLYVIAEIPKPFENPETFLPVGTFVTADLPGKKLENVFRIGDAALMDDAYVWIVDEDNTLRRQPVERVFSGKHDFLARIASPVTAPPLRVVSRPLASFREGGSVTIAPAQVPEP